MKAIKISISLAAVLVGVSVSSNAATLAAYTFPAGGTPPNLGSTSSTAGATPSSIVKGAGLNFHDSGGNFAASGVRALGIGGDGAGAVQVSHSAAEAVTNSDFLSFTITPTIGNQIDVTGFSFAANMASASNISSNFQVQMINSGVNGGNAVVLSTGVDATDDITKIVGGAGTGPADGQLFNFTLTGYAGLTGTTTFRIVFYDTDSATTTWNNNWVRIDDIIVTGNVSPVPEAGSSLLAISGAALFIARRRRK